MSHVPQTPNFKLFTPAFDQKAWHQYANKNFQIIDAVLTTYLDVGNIVGVWENSTSYQDGDRVIDPDVGQVFEAAVNHTSAASPTTFEEDRADNPTFWTSLAVTARGLGAWAPGTLYQPNDFVIAGNIYAVCIATHTSTAVFADDASFWDYLIDLSTLPTLPALTGKSLQVLRVNVGETGSEWATAANIQAWLGLGSAAFVATTTFALASHTHVLADISNMSADARLFNAAANDAAMRTELGLGALATLATVGTAQIDNDAVTYAKIQNVTDARLLGRSAGSAGDVQEITVGSGLSLAAGALTATGGTKAAVLAHKNGTNQTNINSTDTKVTFGTETYDSGGDWNTATSVFTAPRDNEYLVNAVIEYTRAGAADQLTTISFYVNGSPVAAQRQRPSSGSATCLEATEVIRMTASQTLEIYVSEAGAASNGTVNGVAVNTHLSIREL